MVEVLKGLNQGLDFLAKYFSQFMSFSKKTSKGHIYILVASFVSSFSFYQMNVYHLDIEKKNVHLVKENLHLKISTVLHISSSKPLLFPDQNLKTTDCRQRQIPIAKEIKWEF